jgi:hypothetical protein
MTKERWSTSIELKSLPRTEWIKPKSTEWQGKYSTDEEAYKAFAKDYFNRNKNELLS